MDDLHNSNYVANIRRGMFIFLWRGTGKGNVKQYLFFWEKTHTHTYKLLNVLLFWFPVQHRTLNKTVTPMGSRVCTLYFYHYDKFMRWQVDHFSCQQEWPFSCDSQGCYIWMELDNHGSIQCQNRRRRLEIKYFKVKEQWTFKYKDVKQILQCSTQFRIFPSFEQSRLWQDFLVLRQTLGTTYTISHNPYLFFFHLQSTTSASNDVLVDSFVIFKYGISVILI